MRDNPNMESFYEENAAQLSGQTPTITNGGGTMKRPLTLDLGKDLHPAKRLRFNNNTSVISTPDLQMLKMVSPELEKFIMNGGNPMATPTPGLNNYPQKEVSPVELLSVSQIRNEAGQSPGRMECVPFPFRLFVGRSIDYYRLSLAPTCCLSASVLLYSILIPSHWLSWPVCTLLYSGVIPRWAIGLISDTKTT